MRWPFSKLRKKALGVAMEHIHYEDKNSRYLCIGCVEKVLCLIACYVEDPNSEAYKRHLVRIPDYFWLAEDGMKMQVYFTKSSNDLKQCWAHLNEGGNRMVIPYSFRMVIVMYHWPKNDRSVLHIESSDINHQWSPSIPLVGQGMTISFHSIPSESLQQTKPYLKSFIPALS